MPIIVSMAVNKGYHYMGVINDDRFNGSDYFVENLYPYAELSSSLYFKNEEEAIFALMNNNIKKIIKIS